MRRKPELLILAGLLLAAMAFVLWYVSERRANLRATPGPTVTTAPSPVPQPVPSPHSAGPVPGIQPTPIPSPGPTPSSVQPAPPAAMVATMPPAGSIPPAGSTSTPIPAINPPVLPPPSPEPVDLAKHDGQTLDFSGGKPVAKNTPEDQAAIDAAMKDISAAEKEVTFEAPKKDAARKDAPPPRG